MSRNKVKEPLPCPRCGEKAECRVHSQTADRLNNYRVGCTRCQMGSIENTLFPDEITRIDEANIDFISGYNRAVEWWNSRA